MLCSVRVLNDNHIFTYRDTVQKKERELEMVKNSHPATNKGKGLDQVCKRQQRRKLLAVKESVKGALKFTESYHLKLDTVSFVKRVPQHETLTFDYSSPVFSSCHSLSLASTSIASSPLPISPSPNPSTPVSTSTTLDIDSPSSQQSNSPVSPSVSQILYLLDSYGVSDDFYHELSMINNSLPRSYRVKNLRKSLSSNVNMKQIEQGWYVPFGDYLQLALSRISQSGHNLQSPIEIKISGDGAPFYRSSSFILLSFSFPSLDPDSSSASGMVIDIITQEFIAFHLNVGTHTLAVIKGEEKYDVLKNSFSPVINEINDIIVREQITVDRVSYGLKFILGGDYKVSK